MNPQMQMNFIANQWQAPAGEAFLDVVRGVQATHKATGGWSRLSLPERGQYLRQFLTIIQASQSELQNSLLNDLGWPVTTTREVEIPQALQIAHDFIELALSEDPKNFSRLPIGSIGLITGHAQPLQALFYRLMPALLMGNCVLWKPSSRCPQTARLLAELSLQAGWPEGIFNFIQGAGESSGKELSDAFLQHPGLSTLAFIGRSKTGLEVLKMGGENSKKTLLALGAKNAALVLADTNLEQRMPLIVQSAFDFQRQGPLRTSRIFVQDDLYKKFLESFKAEVARSWLASDPQLTSTKIGPVATLEQKQIFDQMLGQALSENGKLLLGEKSAGGLLLQPTAVFDLSFCSTLHHEEVEAPFVTISSFKYAHEAIKQANTSSFGQAAFIWSEDLDRAAKLAAKIEVGRVFINELGALSAKRSFVPAKHSGFGAEGGTDSLDFFSRRIEIWS
jgi:aminomuconate-semialdehyde/2-hydroxymuconate-6-semialdehyde dehydrogenase